MIMRLDLWQAEQCPKSHDGHHSAICYPDDRCIRDSILFADRVHGSRLLDKHNTVDSECQ